MKAKFKNTNYLIIAVFGVLFTAYSCSDSFFDQQAGNRMDPDNHYKSMKDVEVSLAGVLYPMQQLLPKVIVADGLRSDLMDLTSNSDADLQAIMYQNYSADNPYLDGSGFYQVVISANEVLEHVDSVINVDPNFDEYFTKYSKGALIAIRSWAYLNIVKLYGEAALISDNLPSISGDLKQVYIPKQVMIDTLINQLLPYVHNDTKVVELYIRNYVNTKTLLGELYLEKNDYANAALYLKMGLESYANGKNATNLEKGDVSGLEYKVDKTFAKENWKNIFINSEGGAQENIGVIPFSSTEGQWNPMTKWTNYKDLYLVKPSMKMINMFAEQTNSSNKLGDTFRGVEVTFDTIPGTTDYYISKYALDIGEPYSADIVYSRVADIHLLLAEALNRNGDTNLALVLLNKGINGESKKPKGYTSWTGNIGIRGRASLLAKTVPVDIALDPAQAMLYVEDLIAEERAMELAYEGKRFTDLVRIAERRGDPSYLADRVASKFTDEGTKASIRDKMLNPSNWYLPTKKVQ